MARDKGYKENEAGIQEYIFLTGRSFSDLVDFGTEEFLLEGVNFAAQE